ATGGSSYEWNRGPTTDVINVSPLADTEYIVTVTGVNSCQDVDTVLVTVLSLPVIPETPTGITERCQTAETTEFSTSEVSGADSYIWTVFPGESGSNTTDQNTLALNWNLNFTGITGIYVEAVNTCGTSRSDTIYVQTNPSPFPALGNDTTICSGTSLSLDAGFAEVWNWTNGYTSQTIETNEAGTLGVEVFIGSCSNYDEITIFVSDPEVEFGQDTIHSDAAVVLDAGTGFSEYLWNDNSTEQTLLAENPGWYFITVTNEFGCTDYDSVYVDIISGIKFTLEPQISIYPNPVEDKLIVNIDSKYSPIIKIELIGIDSKIIESRAFNGVSNLDEYFDMNSFAPGIYLLKIEFENDSKLFKILKQ
ncbi:MAG: T9SS type A sorting domain-containing protein, partial [Bacteroidales bacterium]|nr:T9SS type A sorting domain-containing protein [Bacteroidales bacterium]